MPAYKREIPFKKCFAICYIIIYFIEAFLQSLCWMSRKNMELENTFGLYHPCDGERLSAHIAEKIFANEAVRFLDACQKEKTQEIYPEKWFLLKSEKWPLYDHFSKIQYSWFWYHQFCLYAKGLMCNSRLKLYINSFCCTKNVQNTGLTLCYAYRCIAYYPIDKFRSGYLVSS